MKIKIYFRKCEEDPPKLLSPMDTDEDTSLLTLRTRLQDLNVFKRLGAFQFWDAEESCRIDVDFEALNSIRDCVHLIPAAVEDFEGGPSKRPQIDNGGESVGTATNNGGVLDTELGSSEPESTDLEVPDPTSSARLTTSEDQSCTHGEEMKSVLLPKEVLELYRRGEEKLCGDLKVQAMEDHKWSLRSWDQDGAAVVKLYCGECRSLGGGSTGKHNKNTVSNLFSNFRKSHLMSAGHIRN